MVVLFHIYPQLDRMGYQGDEIPALMAGVDIFFVISGFIMWRSTELNPARTAVQFYRGRIIRIVPLYWILTTFVVVVLVVAPNLMQTLKFDVSHILKSYLFLPAVNPGDGTYSPAIAIGWTLNYEVFFYLIFGIAIALSKNPMGRFWIIASAIFTLVGFGALFGGEGDLYFYTNDIMIEFIYGIVLGMLHSQIRKSNWAWMVILLGYALLLANSFGGPLPWRSVGYGLPATLIVFGVLMQPDLRFGVFRSLGDVSYSLYLSHFITMSAVGQVWRRIDGPIYLFPVVGILACVVVGYATYYVLERSGILLLRSLFRREPRPAVAG